MYFIRKHNKVYNGTDIVIGPTWSTITPTTKSILVEAFTTRKDAIEQLACIKEPTATISNNLDYDE